MAVYAAQKMLATAGLFDIAIATKKADWVAFPWFFSNVPPYAPYTAGGLKMVSTVVRRWRKVKG